MKTILFAIPGNEKLTNSLAAILSAELGEAEVRHFPDGESYVRILSDVKGKKVILVCTLHHPDSQFLSLLFIARTVRDMGAKHICLVAPYLAYMRQDKQFKTGEAITSRYFAACVSEFADSLITIDPHLHRYKQLSDLYTISTNTLHAAPIIATWLKKHIPNPLLIGPDEESLQWVSVIAKLADVPFIVLKKTRLSDTNVKVTHPKIASYVDNTPILVDDIISTAKTMIETIHHLKQLTKQKPVCIGVHPIFAGNSYNDLVSAGAAKIITCNTISHPTNAIKVDNLLAEAISKVVV